MGKSIIDGVDIDQEIERLNKSEYVRLAQKEIRLKVERKKKRLYQLRWMENRGKALASMGATLDNLESMMATMEADEADGQEG